MSIEHATRERAGISETRLRLSQRESSVLEHIQSVLSAIHASDAELGAFLSVGDEYALRAAEAADVRIKKLGPAAWSSQSLLGIPVAVKDLIQTWDLPTTRGSLLANTRARMDAPAVARLRRAGAIVVGKTTTSEYGWTASTVGRLARPTRNPWHPGRTAGGSSGGSAAAVSAGLVSAALGTDGAGSIRIPASFCGVVGYKPSYGQVPYVPPCAARLSHLGPITANVPDAIEVATVLFGPHHLDPDSRLGASVPVPDRRRLRIGWIEFPGTEPAVRLTSERAIHALSELGHRVERIEVPFSDPYAALVDIFAAAEAADTSAADEARHDPGRLAVVRHGRSLSGAALIRAEQTRLKLRVTLRSVMDCYDQLAMATVPIEPFDADAIGPQWATDPASLRWLAWSPATYPFNLTGQPALSLPAGVSTAGLPVGVQLVGAVNADALLMRTARDLGAALGSLPRPAGWPLQRGR